MARKHRYKKTFYSQCEIPALYERVKGKFEIFKMEYDQKRISDCELVALGVLTLIKDYHGNNILGSKRKKLKDFSFSKLRLRDYSIFDNNFLNSLHPLEVFSEFNLKSCPGRINSSLLLWLDSKWPLNVIFYDPCPREMLDLQIEGKRIISFPSRKEDFVLKEGRDPLSFLFHDLFHADQFFSAEKKYLEQIEFFKKLKSEILLGNFDSYIDNDNFQKDFNYLIADMNTHPAHQQAYLEAILHKYRKEALRFTV